MVLEYYVWQPTPWVRGILKNHLLPTEFVCTRFNQCGLMKTTVNISNTFGLATITSSKTHRVDILGLTVRHLCDWLVTNAAPYPQKKNKFGYIDYHNNGIKSEANVVLVTCNNNNNNNIMYFLFPIVPSKWFSVISCLIEMSTNNTSKKKSVVF